MVYSTVLGGIKNTVFYETINIGIYQNLLGNHLSVSLVRQGFDTPLVQNKIKFKNDLQQFCNSFYSSFRISVKKLIIQIIPTFFNY